MSAKTLLTQQLFKQQLFTQRLLTQQLLTQQHPATSNQATSQAGTLDPATPTYPSNFSPSKPSRRCQVNGPINERRAPEHYST